MFKLPTNIAASPAAIIAIVLGVLGATAITITVFNHDEAAREIHQHYVQQTNDENAAIRWATQAHATYPTMSPTFTPPEQR